ncbi:MAG TPA: 3-oxoacyl-[acyl-carrier-protein] synthase III C-terminal domain-containing protein [Rhodothermales bacterium]|nr:3-oxoacyl-[acyl-carrier-protein] synthase III C-terminal domain-containing protein [Rhodothermales bacterium]
MRTPRAYVAVRPLLFGYPITQAQGVAWMKEAMERAAPAAGLDPDELARARRYYALLERATPIRSRVTCVHDYTHTDWDAMTLWREGDGKPWYEAPLERRTAIFAETALALARAAFEGEAEAPDLLMQVSCTGYDSPTALQRLAVERGWMGARLLHLGHMGCYAALPAVATAADLVAAETARRRAPVPVGGDGGGLPLVAPIGGDGAPAAADEGDDVRAVILLVELCSLHHHPTALDPEHIVQQALFADGAARVDVSASPLAGGFALLDHAEALVPGSLDAMTWAVADGAFKMTLARSVPNHLRDHLAPVVGAFLAGHGLTVADVPLWAVHPGGPKIIESSAEALGLSEASVRHSHAVLAARGNMSSTTLPHIWAAMADDPEVRPGSLVVSLAYGPGLTVAMSLMETHPGIGESGNRGK